MPEMPEKLNPKTFLKALGIVVTLLVIGTLIVVVIIAPSVVVHDHRAEETLIKKHWPAGKQ
jgi:hypothetical protein